MMNADEALRRLKEGNQRFIEERSAVADRIGATRRGELVEGQAPFAIILGCSDSRVPAEVIFDQGLGDLFAIRVAGNIVAPSQIGSVEFAADTFGTRLVVVLGHTQCGAVKATIDQLEQPFTHRSPHLKTIVDFIRPGLEHLDGTGPKPGVPALGEAVRANIHASVEGLRHGSKILEELIEGDGLQIVGAEYDLGSGRVEFFD